MLVGLDPAAVSEAVGVELALELEEDTTAAAVKFAGSRVPHWAALADAHAA